MSRMGDDFWEKPVDRRATVKAAFDELGISRDTKAPIPGPVSSARWGQDTPAYIAELDGFLEPPGSYPISPALAEQLHYHPPAPVEGAAGEPSTDEGYEGMRRE